METRVYRWQGFITFAESYGQAANHTSQIRLMHEAPVGALACHCIELSLKAVLLTKGASEDDLRRHGHRLRSLFEASGLDWSDIDTNALGHYHAALLEHAFRYRDSHRPYVVEASVLLPMMEVVFHRCLQAVSPGAKRSLCPRPLGREGDP